MSSPKSTVTTTHLVLPEHTNAIGTIFGGQLMAWMDIAAAICAHRHARTQCVTVSVDELHFKAPVKLGHVVNITAALTYTHVSSMEILVTATSESIESTEATEVCSAYFTFVTRAAEGKKKISVPSLKPVTAQEKKEFAAAAKRRERRLQSRS